MKGGTVLSTLDEHTAMLTSRQDSTPPLDIGDSLTWERCLEGAGPASLLVVIQSRLGSVASEVAAEDVLQEVLLKAWHSRSALEWRGHRAFRSWLLTLADHCIADWLDRVNAAKRGGGNVRPFSVISGPDMPPPEGPPGTTTPSRLAVYREQAAVIRTALDELPDDVRDIVRMRLFEQRSLNEVAQALGLPLSTVQHRVRRGAALFKDRVRSVLGSERASVAPKAGKDSVP
ncbi:MAG: RNA polymerase sigma factor [Phycisphaerales bacterium]